MEEFKQKTIAMFGQEHWNSMYQIVMHESGFNFKAVNKGSGATGLCQALPATKMAVAGLDYLDNPSTQINWCLDYVKQRYTNPISAWNFWQNNRWF